MQFEGPDERSSGLLAFGLAGGGLSIFRIASEYRNSLMSRIRLKRIT
jgi:hypothetical protein